MHIIQKEGQRERGTEREKEIGVGEEAMSTSSLYP